MTSSEYAEAWVRRYYRFQPNEEALVHILAEYLALRNEMFEDPSQWSTPGPELRKQWKAHARMFTEECRHNGIPEKNMPACLRWCVDDYRKVAKQRGWHPQPPTIKSLLNWICQYDGHEMNKYSNVYETESTMTDEEVQEKIKELEKKEWPHDY